MKKSSSGFTIVEPLIVIVVIAILAAISVVAYAGIRNRANDTAVKSDLVNFTKKMEAYRAINGNYPINLTQLRQVTEGFSVAQAAYDTSYYTFTFRHAIDRSKFVIAAKSKSGKIWYQSTDGSGESDISTTYGPFVASLIGISDPPTEPMLGVYGYNLNTDTWADWTQ